MGNVFIVIQRDFICHGGIGDVKHKDLEGISALVARRSVTQEV